MNLDNSTPSSNIKLNSSWLAVLESEFQADYMKGLKGFLKERLRANAQIYPKPSEYFRALNETPLEQVKVVILGQDPYHGPGQAHGLSFSVPQGMALPPSLVNIYKELHSDLGVVPTKSGDLTKWAQQGVLLLNSVLSVENGMPASHQGRGWERFTDQIIQKISTESRHCVFILWGSYAQKKGQFIDRSKHLVISSVHPSPLSAYRGFFGSRPFSKANDYLAANGRTPVDWSLE